MSKPTAYDKEYMLRADIRAFTLSCARHLGATIVAVLGGSVATFYQATTGNTVPIAIAWTVGLCGFFAAAFLGWRDERRSKENSIKERDDLIKKQTPLFILTCNSSLPECKVSTMQDYYRDREIYGMMQKEKFLSRPAVWFRMIVNVECPTSIEKCTGYIIKIEKKANPLPIPEKFQVTFCNGSEPDAFAKTISRGVPEYLDILYWEQGVGIRIFSKVQPNSVDMVKLFSEQGEYILTVVVTGGSGVAPKEARLKFNWTGKIDTTELTLI
jgi:hypothetical protein